MIWSVFRRLDLFREVGNRVRGSGPDGALEGSVGPRQHLLFSPRNSKCCLDRLRLPADDLREDSGLRNDTAAGST